MLDTIMDRIRELTAEMSTAEWVFAAFVTGLLVLAIVKQMTKLALVAVIMVAAGLFVLHGQAENWRLHF